MADYTVTVHTGQKFVRSVNPLESPPEEKNELDIEELIGSVSIRNLRRLVPSLPRTRPRPREAPAKGAPRKQELRQRLSTYYKIDLSTTPAPAAPAEPPSRDAAIIERQWLGFAAMGDEWMECAGRNEEFLLLGGSVRRDGPVGPSITAVDDMQLTALPQTTMPAPTSRQAGSAHPHPLAHTSEIPAAPVLSASMRSETVGLECLNTTLERLERAEGLLAVLEQLKSGLIHRLRDKYGPPLLENGKSGRGAAPEYRGTDLGALITKRIRLGDILAEFGGDEARFLEYCKLPEVAGSKNKKAAKGGDGYRAFRRIVEALPWCDKDIEKERKSAEYRGDDGGFSAKQWKAKWGEQNKWEVWRALEKERYKKV
uniref:Uncharacterized protein n=1 Tax=Mycena chlorophos TaxID=658473 RepID=A0ABQ0LF83_MYCCL|nr:predicted protein [Mycena chlorophos]